MKTIILAAVAAISLGTGAAFAQGAPPGYVPHDYGSKAFANQSYHNGTVFSELFGHSGNDQVRRTAEQNAPLAKGS